MKDNITPFGYDDKLIRVITDETTGEPLWIAKDVCEALTIKNHRDALGKLDTDEKGVVKTDTLGGSQEMAVVNESGLYNLIFRSNKPEAKKFKKWVTSEVLPSIRKTGSYSVDKNIGFAPVMEMLKKMMDAIVANSNAILELATAIKENSRYMRESAFENSMEIYSITEQLNMKNLDDTLSTDMLDSIRKEVISKAKSLSMLHDITDDDARRLIYSKLNSKFVVSTYYKIPYMDFNKAMYFIAKMTLSNKKIVAVFEPTINN